MKKIAIISLISICGFAFLASTALAGYGSKKKLSGYVKEYKTLKPLAKAKVKLYKKNGRLKDTERTGKKGKYKFSDLSKGTYKLKVKLDGYRNPKDVKKDTLSKSIVVKKNIMKNLYLQKI